MKVSLHNNTCCTTPLTQQRECDSKHEDNDCPKHVDDQISCSQDDENADHRVIALELPRLSLLISAVHVATESNRDCCETQHHLHRVKDSVENKKAN